VEVKSGQTRKFAVPVIDVDVSFRELMGGQMTALPAATGTYTPVPALPAGNGVSLEEGLKVAETQTVTRTARSAAPIPQGDDEIPFGAAPVPVDEPGAPALTPTPQAPPSDKTPTKAMIEKLNALVGQLREAQEINTEQLWAALAKDRGVKVDDMIALLNGRDDLGLVHWSPLRDDLTREEASALHKRLAKLWATTQTVSVA